MLAWEKKNEGEGEGEGEMRSKVKWKGGRKIYTQMGGGVY